MKFGKWEFIRDAGKDKNGIPISECKCKCGFVKYIQTNSLVKGKTKKCNSCRKKESMKKLHIGKKYGMLTIIDQIPGKYSLCRCDCGIEKIIKTGSITSGGTVSCGCKNSINRVNYNEDALKKIKSSVSISPSGCWEWQKSRHRQGYGNFPYKRKVYLAHRISWILHKGPISDDILVLHKCDNPPCCNPEHLFLGTDKSNAEDRVKKGRCNHPFGSDQWCAKLTPEIVREIRRMHMAGKSIATLCDKFSVHRATIYCLLKRITWRHVD